MGEPAKKRGEKVLVDRFKIRKRLGSGSFGEVFLAQDLQTGDDVAVKLERSSSRNAQLYIERKVYKALKGGVGIPKLRWYGNNGKYNILVTDRLGKSLEDLFVQEKREFNDLTVLLVGKQMLERIEYMHHMHFIHRDIKPDNFLSGYGRRAPLIYVIDFGLSKRYRHPKTRKHIAYKEGKSLTGTPRYASVNNHLGCEQSRRDDIESIAYVLLYLARGSLPWQGLKAKNKKMKYKRIMEKKASVTPRSLCENCPPSLEKLLTYCKNLRFEDKPNYAYLKELFVKEIEETFGEGEHLPQWCRTRKKERKEEDANDNSKIGRQRRRRKGERKEKEDKNNARNNSQQQSNIAQLGLGEDLAKENRAIIVTPPAAMPLPPPPPSPGQLREPTISTRNVGDSRHRFEDTRIAPPPIFPPQDIENFDIEDPPEPPRHNQHNRSQNHHNEYQ